MALKMVLFAERCRDILFKIDAWRNPTGAKDSLYKIEQRIKVQVSMNNVLYTVQTLRLLNIFSSVFDCRIFHCMLCELIKWVHTQLWSERNQISLIQ